MTWTPNKHWASIALGVAAAIMGSFGNGDGAGSCVVGIVLIELFA